MHISVISGHKWRPAVLCQCVLSLLTHYLKAHIRLWRRILSQICCGHCRNLVWDTINFFRPYDHYNRWSQVKIWACLSLTDALPEARGIRARRESHGRAYLERIPKRQFVPVYHSQSRTSLKAVHMDHWSHGSTLHTWISRYCSGYTSERQILVWWRDGVPIASVVNRDGLTSSVLATISEPWGDREVVVCMTQLEIIVYTGGW